MPTAIEYGLIALGIGGAIVGGVNMMPKSGFEKYYEFGKSEKISAAQACSTRPAPLMWWSKAGTA